MLDHFSRRVVGFSVLVKEPTAEQVCEMLGRAVERVGQAPASVDCPAESPEEGG